MHDLMVFFSTLGGIAMFGAMGFIVGPVVAALFLAVLEIYALEFKDVLDDLNAEPAPLPTEPSAGSESAQASAAGAKRAEG